MAATGKALAAFITKIWFISSVLSHVKNAATVQSKGFATVVTSERFFTGVDSYMLNQLVLVVKLLVTFQAFNGLFFFLWCEFAKFEMIACGKTFPTFRAKIGFFLGVRPHVNKTSRVLREVFSTVITAEGFFTGVNSHMPNELAPIFKLLVAVHAVKGFAPIVTPFYMPYKERFLLKTFTTKLATFHHFFLPWRLLQLHNDFNAVTLTRRR